MRRLEEALFRRAGSPRRARRAALGLVAAVAPVPGASRAAAAPQPEPRGTHDAGGFRNVLPPAQGRNANLAEIGAFEANDTYPSHTSDKQLDMYSRLVNATPGLKRSQIPDYYKDATFGVAPAQQEGQPYSPRNDVTIVRDKFGVPHIYGSDRQGAMFGAGYAAGEDRLFMMDVLRHAARAQLSSFAGGSPSNRAMDRSIWADTPYKDDSELQAQYDRADELYGQQGVLVQHDVTNYVDGINQFISEACVNQTKLPGEYSLLTPDNNICQAQNQWKTTDVIAIASLVAGIFGKGGGNELESALALEAARKRFGKAQGKQVWADFREQNDPERPLTVRKGRFPYERTPHKVRGRALPDPGTVHFHDVVQSSSPKNSSPSPSSKFPDGDRLLTPLDQLAGASNALLVSGRESKGGHPVAVMGPQVAYFSPEILMEEDIHAPGGSAGPPIDARGAAFPGTNLYVQLGHGRNYAWSATSAGQDIIDTFAVKLCDPNGGTATLNSDHYRFQGQCVPFDVLDRTNQWAFESPGGPPSPGTETLRSFRSKLGIVIARARIGGKPYAYTKLRDTYFHEVDPSAIGFADYNNPRKMGTPHEFMRSACNISYTFNWFYVNRHHIAYFNSGQNPVRAPNVDPNFPTLGTKRFWWRGYDPDTATEHQTPCSAHPHVVDQRFLTSWNNGQAHGYSAADDNFTFGPIFRSNMLDEQLKPRIAGPRKITRQKLIDAMEVAGTVDMRGDRVLPWLLRVLRTGSVSDPKVQNAVATLAQWQASGAHRVDMNKDGHYDHSRAVRIMDAWWPRLLTAEFEPTLGHKAYASFRGMMPIDDPPGPVGSAYIEGWGGYVSKDLRTILNARVRGPYSRVYCGHGHLDQCRGALERSLKRALRHDGNKQLYPGGSCELGHEARNADPQQCHDAIDFTAVGAIAQPLIPWVNRPTFQQAVQVK